MGPILQERTTSTILKRVPVKEKIRVKNSENTEIVTRYESLGGTMETIVCIYTVDHVLMFCLYFQQQ